MNQKNRMIWIPVLIYAAMMAWLLLGRERSEVALRGNFVPFHTIALYLNCLRRGQMVTVAIYNLAGNVLLFIPLGWFVPRLVGWARRFSRTMLICFGLIAAVELAQPLLRVGTCDVDDLILNLAGAALGCAAYLAMRKWKERAK